MNDISRLVLMKCIHINIQGESNGRPGRALKGLWKNSQIKNANIASEEIAIRPQFKLQWVKETAEEMQQNKVAERTGAVSLGNFNETKNSWVKHRFYKLKAISLGVATY